MGTKRQGQVSTTQKRAEMKTIVYTALFGCKSDKLLSVRPSSSVVQHVCFSERPKREVGLWQGDTIISGTLNITARHTWKMMPVGNREWSSRQTARYYKCMPHTVLPEADVWIWVDSNVRLLVSPEELVSRWLPTGCDLATFDHSQRNCLYDEVVACINQRKDSAALLRRQMQAYLADGMPHNWGLAETRVVIRRNTPQIRTLNEMWWNEIKTRSVRDQVALPYVCWKLGVRWAAISTRWCYPNNDIYRVLGNFTKKLGVK